jgi:hypothetical protein
MKKLCVPPKGEDTSPAPAGPTPPEIATVEHQVEAVRGLSYIRPVGVEPITQSQMDAKLSRSFDASYPAAFWNRRSRAWQTIGVIPAGTSLLAALLKFQTGEVAGFYDPDKGRLVYIGTTQLDLIQKFTLAHELTHAIDDQHFNLRRLEAFDRSCSDEHEMAALGAVEGSAQYFATQVLQRFPDDLPLGNTDGGGSLDGVPPFLTALELWPYTAGQAFITALDARGGLAAVNQAIRHLPSSTEQVMHPELYPNDTPQPVDVANLGRKLGAGWHDLDVEQVGEEWLKEMLELRSDADTAARAAAGWDGGLYRAWSDGTNTAVVLKTVWDAPADAADFANSAKQWIADSSGQQAFVVQPDASTVEIGFASDAATLASLRAADRLSLPGT